MAFELPSLPYSKTALAAKGMCEETLELHHDKHHQAYVTALNGFVEKDPSLQGKSLEEIVKLSHNKPDMAPVRPAARGLAGANLGADRQQRLAEAEGFAGDLSDVGQIDALVARGVSRNSLDGVGVGATDPADERRTPDARAKNRRVELMPIRQAR